MLHSTVETAAEEPLAARPRFRGEIDMPLPKPAETIGVNRFLAALPSDEFERLKDSLETVELEQDQQLWDTGAKGKYLYFPTTSLISLLYEGGDGSSISIATLGRNGIIGTSLVLGSIRMPDRAVVQFSGTALRMDGRRAEEEFSDCGVFQSLLIAHTQLLINRISQNAICNRLHVIEQQVARMLLDFADELQTDAIAVTHDQLSGILGVRRESVSLAVSHLQSRKLVEARRGKITIKDDKLLESASCECYAIVKKDLEQSLAKFNSSL